MCVQITHLILDNTNRARLNYPILNFKVGYVVKNNILIPSK